MNKPEEVDLVGYLLGALDADEREQVEAALDLDPNLQDQLQLLDDHLHQMRIDGGQTDAPPGLVERTCSAVTIASQGATLRPALSERAPTSRKWTMIDVAVGISICLAALTLFFPAVVSSRQNARVLACQEKLRELGTALSDYNDRNYGRFPAPQEKGNLSVAGSYGPILFNAGYISEPSVLICPASSLADRLDNWHVPTFRELENARGERLLVLQRTMGGSFAHTLGYVVDGKYYPTTNLGRSNFVVMSDAPLRSSAGWESANHGGRGQNVMFEDFHIDFVKDCCFQPGGDVFFENNDGLAAAGVGKNDAVVGASATPPLNYVRLER